MADGKATVKRQTEFGYDVIEAPLPAVVAVSDAINEPRYPSLKGIMGAKSKPQETVSLADLGVEGDARRARLADRGLRVERSAAARRLEEDRGRRQRGAGDPRLPRGEEARMTTLVFLEHHGDELLKGRSACSRRRRRSATPTSPASSSARACARSPTGGRVRRREGLGRRRCALEAPLPQPRVDVLAQLVREQGIDTVLFGNSVLAADVAAGLAARLDAGLNWDLSDLVQQDGKLVGKRPALQDSVYVDVGWKSEPRHRALPLRHLRSERDRRRARKWRTCRSRSRTSRRRRAMVEQAHEESEGPSIEDARGHRRRRPRARRPGELHARRGAREGAGRRRRRDARGRRRRLVPVLDPGRPDRQDRVAEALHRVRHLGRDPAQGRHAGLRGDRRDQQGLECADLRVLGSRRRRRRARGRAEADRARQGTQGRDDQARRLSASVSQPRITSRRRAIRRTSGSRSAF